MAKKYHQQARKTQKTSSQRNNECTLYINRTGCKWRILPKDFAPWQKVYCYFRKWKIEGVIEYIMDRLHSIIRRAIGRDESPGMGFIDSRSVKTSHHTDSSCKGFYGNK